MYDLVIIGSGAAGLSAGLYAARGRIKTVVFEKLAPGGQLLLMDNIENYPSIDSITGADLAQKMLKHATQFGLEVKYEEITGLNFKEDYVELETPKEKYKTKYCIFAGGSNPRRLGIPGENEYTGRGVSYCATCDGAFFKDKECVVIGGGNSAFDEGIALTKYARKITIIHRRSEFSADKYLQETASKNDKIEFLTNHTVEEIMSDEEGKVDRVLLHDLQKDKKYEFKTQGVFVFVGYEPNTALLEGKVEIDKGYVVVDINMKSSHDRLYATGDIRKNAVKQVITSSGDGATAAINIMRKLRSEKD